MFRRDVQQTDVGRKKIGFFLQVQPHEPMPLQRKAARAQGIIPGLQSAIWQKPAIRPPFYGALVPASVVERCYGLKCGAAHHLQVSPGHLSYQQTDQSFHAFNDYHFYYRPIMSSR
jgi:hypothetical protein